MPLLYSLSLSLSLAFALQVAGMMNRATRLALNSQANPFNLRAISLFHSTPVLDRKRRTHWDSGGGAYKNTSRRFDTYSKRFRKLQSKQTLLRNVGAFAEHLFQVFIILLN
ncbi:hypothetical protein RHMOL_Rhmol03G0007100 [Rhododendron molle]|uniref:Uncharacterized protein n=1 Tax=Rhododendron molle TaxID=49168 RepID=A0ACC0PAN5_RHOML|nr:hypothetical protein RHMOL_Rhmol03G0007100 [Rhododendron molle]